MCDLKQVHYTEICWHRAIHLTNDVETNIEKFMFDLGTNDLNVCKEISLYSFIICWISYLIFSVFEFDVISSISMNFLRDDLWRWVYRQRSALRRIIIQIKRDSFPHERTLINKDAELQTILRQQHVTIQFRIKLF